ncbi:MAG: 4Fe-4S dicluster domain-containing protein [Bryobacteraceae bacterium]|nr:4Fe-4S dicluster domain-containing protein [Bryobacteraceae bacterium]
MAASEPVTSVPAFPPILDNRHAEAPAAADLLSCIHCGLCLNACPTYRELGVEMDSPRGRIYQMMQVATGQAEISPSYLEHLDLCLACRGCESACPSGVHYGRLIEAARAEIEAYAAPKRSWRERALRNFVFRRLLVSRGWLKLAGALLYLYQASGLQSIARGSGVLKLFGKLGRIERLAPNAEIPFFFDKIGKTFAPAGPRRYRVGLLAGCIANVTSARLNEATVRVLQQNGCEVLVPESQTCCGALHVHAGLKQDARELARRNIDAFLPLADNGGLDAVVTNGAGCGSTLKEYHELLAEDPEYREKAARFAAIMKDITEFLASIELNTAMGRLEAVVTYQDSCHLAHGQKIRQAPRQILKAIPGLQFREMPLSDLCCGSAGTYNVVHDDIADSIIAKKIPLAAGTGATVIATANVGCELQLKAGVARYGQGQRVAHVVELLDEAYQKLGR